MMRRFTLYFLMFLFTLSTSPLMAEDANGVLLNINPGNIYVDIWTDIPIYGEGHDSDTVTVSGTTVTNLQMTFDPDTQYVTGLTGIEFDGGTFIFSTIDLKIDYFLGPTITATGTGIGGEFDTLNPPGFVEPNGDFWTQKAGYSFDHQVVLNQGVFEADAGVFGSGSTDFLTEPSTNSYLAMGHISVGLPEISGNLATYDVNLSLPLDYDETNVNGDLSLRTKINGTFSASGQFSREFTPPVADVTLGLVDNGCPDTGLHSYTLTATGPGITTLSQFTIDGEVHQVFDAGGNPSEWLDDGSASESETTDSHVIFGDLRLPDLGGVTWPDPGDPPDYITEETISGEGNSGMGTLDNYDDSGTPTWDAYIKTGVPSGEETVELMQLVVEDGDGFSIDLTVLTSEYHDPVTGESLVTTHDLSFSLPSLTAGDANGDDYVDSTDVSILSQHWLQSGAWADGDFNRDGVVNGIDATMLATNWNPQVAGVPEPSTLVLLAGMLLAVGLLRWKTYSSLRH